MTLSASPDNKAPYSGTRVSSIEVARLAGVSQSAVSRAFTPGASVSDETREKVLKAAKELGYRPNVIARSLTQQSSNIIGLVVGSFTNPFYAKLVEDFTERFQKKGYWTLIFNVADGNEVEDTLPIALQYQVAGIVMTSATLTSTLADECARYGTPVVLFNRIAIDTNVNAVTCDSVACGRMVADALIDAGHQKLAYLAGQAGSSTNRDRRKGFTQRLQERGYGLHLEASGDYSYASGYAAAQQLFDRADRPDAIFCANDLMAMAALDVAKDEFNLRVPQDVSIIGFDDIEMAGWPHYSLTTVRQPVTKMVDATIEVLYNAIEAPGDERIVRLIAGDIVDRGSARLASGHTTS